MSSSRGGDEVRPRWCLSVEVAECGGPINVGGREFHRAGANFWQVFASFSSERLVGACLSFCFTDKLREEPLGLSHFRFNEVFSGR